jgi:hypothetical protein
MADVALFNSALSQIQLQNLFSNAYPHVFPPVVLAQPSSVQLFAGQTANLNVTVSGSAPLTFQWQTNSVNLGNGGNISGATTSALTISNASAANSGTYALVITNVAGSTSTTPIGLTIIPTNGYAGAVINAGALAFWQLNETNNPAVNYTAYDYLSGLNGTYGPVVGGVNSYNGLNGYSGITGPRPSDGFIGFSANNAATEFTGDTSVGAGNPSITNNVSGDPNSAIYLPPTLFNTNTVTFTAWIYPIGGQKTSTGLVFSRPGSAAGLIYCNAAGGNGFASGLGANWANEGASTGWNPAGQNPQLLPPTNQWSFVALVVSQTNLTLFVANTNYLAQVSQTVSNTPFNFTTADTIGYDTFADTRIFNGKMAAVALFTNSLSQSQLVKLYNAASTVQFTAPSITTQPVSQTNSVGQTVQFSVAASGAPVLGYQWQFKGTNLVNGGGIAGATTTNLTISGITTNNAGNYTAVVTNYLGSATSSAATLTVVPPSVVTLTNHFSGGNLTLSWSQGSLLEATNLSGPWVTNPAASPYTVPPTNPMTFFRVRVQ